jgi:predicted AAA+ superfamily ATPase
MNRKRGSHEGACYISADTLQPEDDLWDDIRKLQQHYGFHTFLIDEAHFLPDAPGLLKRLYDFLDVRVLFSSSVALAMRASAHDLSRRVRLLELHNFSFREYLHFSQDLHLPVCRLDDLAGGNWSAEHLRAGRFFEDYLVRGRTDKLVVEVGGKGKGREQFKGVKIDRKLIFAHTDVPDRGRLPLFLAGFLV